MCPNRCLNDKGVLTLVDMCDIIDHMKLQCPKTEVNCTKCGHKGIKLSDQKTHDCADNLKFQLAQKENECEKLRSLALCMKENLQKFYQQSNNNPIAPKKKSVLPIDLFRREQGLRCFSGKKSNVSCLF